MSSYDKPSGAGTSTATGHGAFSQHHPQSSNQFSSSRQQLPSLHSLFGPPPAIRTLHAPAAGRETPYLAQSPLERPRPSPSIGSGAKSYFPSTSSPPVSQPRSTYDARQDAYSMTRPFSGTQSPKFFEGHQSRSDSRPKSESSQWSTHPDMSYTLGARDASFRSPQDRPRTQLPTSKDLHRDYSGHRTVQSFTGAPPTPDSSAVSEGVPTKDGLGPKIWTGSHFLPRFVRATEVPGEGMCYFYDDGSHCKTVIDGEAVNAHWGVTKAGKPRKRLAIACITCREKKIKCDPDYPRCVQCEKFGRVCKFKNAPRGGHNVTSPSTPPAELDGKHNARSVSRQNDQQHSSSRTSSPVSPRIMLHEPCSETGYANKRAKLGQDSYATNGEPLAGMPGSMDHSKSLLSAERAASDTPRCSQIPDDVLHRAWQMDPFVSDPQAISTVLSRFFGHFDNAIVIRFLPEDVFKSWASSSKHQKGPEDLMLLYSVLACGVALSGGPKHISYEYAQVAYFAQKSLNAPCLQLIQSRILLALYNIATSRLWEANELVSSAIATGACLQLNREVDHSSDAALTKYPFDMTRTGYAEARRRTFWSLFMLERLSPLFPERATMIHSEDIYIRLPSDTESFEKQVDACMPVFSPYTSISVLAEGPSDITCHFVEMIHIWSSCQSTINRLANRPNASKAEGLQIRTLTKRVHDWHTTLPSRLSFNGSNLESAAFSGKVGPFLTMHLLCHHALILLNRYHSSVAELSVEYRTSHFQKCHENARSIVDIVCCLDRILRIRPSILTTPPPALATVGTTAMDILSSTGSLGAINDTISHMRVVKTAVDSTSHIWEPARVCQQLLDRRLQNLCQIRDQGCLLISTEDFEVGNYSGDESEQPRWQIYRPLERAYPFDMDVIYCFPN
ncbi:hypothetical protein E4U41_007151 [Claviceps citrina]|nr:hypothetical protein E4U41_007151 [Claviceps citrina]